MNEQEIIRRYFSFPKKRNVSVGVGDDACVLTSESSKKLLVSTDTLVEKVHFFSDVSPISLAKKAAAVSLSDIAAMGGKAEWLLISLTTPALPAQWFAHFAQGLEISSQQYDYSIAGGDLTRGERVSVTSTVIGKAQEQVLLRSGAQVGDDVWLSGQTGEASYAVSVREKKNALLPAAVSVRLDEPQPRLDLGIQLSNLAHSAMDISDGLISAAKAISAMSEVSLEIQMNHIPQAETLSHLSDSERWHHILSGGDDYELIFTASPKLRNKISSLATVSVPITRIGSVVKGNKAIFMLNGEQWEGNGYEHHFGD